MTNKFDLKKAYTVLVDRLKAEAPIERAMQQAIGGQFEAFGIIEMEMLRHYGLRPEHTLIDVGCGSGRLAIPLSRSHPGRYIGTDLVPDLLDHARARCNRADWRFEPAGTGMAIPAPDRSADIVCFFSVLTHLLHEQSFLYLEEARRVLRPGGKVVFSFLEFRMPFHWDVFSETIRQIRVGEAHPLNVFIDRDAIAAWAEHLDMVVEEIRGGNELFVPLPAPLTLEDGRVMEGHGNLGQSVCVLVRPS